MDGSGDFQARLLAELEEEWGRRVSENRLAAYRPYSKQAEFHAAGATHRERLFLAGNQLGKCLSYQTLITHPDGTETPIGILAERGRAFDVLSWDGERFVAARAVPVRKPAEDMWRLRLESGEYIDAAGGHRLLMRDGTYASVSRLQEFFAAHRASTPEFSRSARGVGAPGWMQIPQGLLDRCFASFRQHGEQLQFAADIGQASFPYSGGVPTHSRSYGRSDGQARKSASSLFADSVRRSTLDGPARLADQSAGSLGSTQHTGALPPTAKHQASPLHRIAKFDRPQSSDARSRDRDLSSLALFDPSSVDGNKIVSIAAIGIKDIFDMTVLDGPPNYLAHGVVHHNTVAGSFEAAIHLTGKYPEWWVGRRWDRPVVGWAAGVTGETTRDTVQRMLLGRPGQLGTGAIPKSSIIDSSRALGVADLMDTVRVRHVSGKESIVAFKFYEKGREKWQAETLDFVWDDEEPPQDIYSEGLTRTNATGGMTWLTATPLKGMTDVIKSFVISPIPSRHTTTMTIDDAEHYTPEQRAEIIASYPLHERDARARGIPILGSGRVFPVAEESIAEDAIQIPEIWARIAGHDFGWDHPQATVWLAHDRDNDVVHVTDCYRVRETTPILAAATIKSRGAWIPVAWPHDGLQHDKGSGEELANQYRKEGVKMLPERATFEDGGNGVEAGIMDMLDRMQTGRLKVARHLVEWWEEFRLYHRKNGIIVKEGDDLMSATRYGIMMLRRAVTRPKPSVRSTEREAPSGPHAWLA